MESKIKIQIVDDSKISRNVILADFQGEDVFLLREYEDAHAAHDDLPGFMPDVIISDYDMPGMNGFDYCRKVRKHPELKEIPFILISGKINLAHRSDAFEAGITEIFEKPFKKFELSRYIRSHLHGTEEGGRYNLLVIDDDPTSQSHMSLMLADLNFDLHPAVTLQEARNLLESKAIDLIILDYNLPDGNGIDFLRELRKQEKFRYLPLLAISEKAEMSIAFINNGADDCLPKPFVIEEVRTRVQKEIKRTDMKRDFEALVEREKALSFQKNRLLGIAAHDLRSPVTNIIGICDLLEDHISGKEGRELLDNIKSASVETLNLLEETLNVSDVENSLPNIRKKTINIRELVESRVAFMKGMCRKKSIHIKLSDKLQNKDAMLRADAGKLSQVMDNLISNAIKYSHPNTIVFVGLEKHDEGILISVKDFGVGIPEEDLPRLFMPFEKINNHPTGNESKTGLGLHIVKKIVEGHGGTIWVESKNENGSTFQVTLPA